MGNTQSRSQKTWLEENHPTYFKGATHAEFEAVQGHVNDFDSFAKVIKRVNMNCIYRTDKTQEGILELTDDIDIMMIQGRLHKRDKEKRRELYKSQMAALSTALSRIEITIPRSKL